MFRSQRVWAAMLALGLVLAMSGGLDADAAKKRKKKDADQKSTAAAPVRQMMSDPTRAGRSMSMSQHGMVASSHVLASQAGLDILRDGGTAMDAAVAMAATLGVVEPAMIGIGGDAFFLYYEAKSGKVYAYNGSGRSPKNLPRSYFDEKEKQEIDEGSWEAVTVPGAVDAYAAGLERFGKKSFAEVLAPAIRYAEEGYPVHEVVGLVWASYAGKLQKHEWSKKLKLKDGRAPRVGEIFHDPALGASLRKIAEGGRDAFYKGDIAKEIVRYSDESGGFLTLDDFASHTGDWTEPLSTNYRGYDVWQCPPNGQGMGVLMMLNILEGYDMPAMEFQSAEYLHVMIEAKKLAYADLSKFVGDPARGDIPVKGLLSKEYAEARRNLIDPKHAADAVDPGTPPGGDTAYMTAVDQWGNACSFINSLYAPFGTGIVGGNTGFPLQNRGGGFTLEKGHFNEYKPGVRPYQTIIPGMVTKDGKLYMSYGLMGGSMQPQGHVQFLLSHIDHGLTIQQAADMPRWRHMSGQVVRFEPGYRPDVLDQLRAMGHQVKPGVFTQMGGAQAIMVNPDTGILLGSSDPRKDGAAMGY